MMLCQDPPTAQFTILVFIHDVIVLGIKHMQHPSLYVDLYMMLFH